LLIPPLSLSTRSHSQRHPLSHSYARILDHLTALHHHQSTIPSTRPIPNTSNTSLQTLPTHLTTQKELRHQAYYNGTSCNPNRARYIESRTGHRRSSHQQLDCKKPSKKQRLDEILGEWSGKTASGARAETCRLQGEIAELLDPPLLWLQQQKFDQRAQFAKVF
jgi:hypothetical protein